MLEDEPLNGFTGFARREKAQFQYSRDIQRAADEAAVPFDDSTLADIPATERRWAWCEVSLDAVRHNAQEAKRRLQPGVRLMAIVKADAYGHGATECATAALEAGASSLGVATVEEALSLRAADIDAPILVLAQPPEGAIPLLLAHRVTPTVYTPEFALAYGEAADVHNMLAPFHLAINSGMNRIGVRPEDAVEFARQISFHRALVQEGTFTHFATADFSDTTDFDFQVRRFTDAVSALRNAGFDVGCVHAANSASIFRFPNVHFDMVRLGLSLYGYHACEHTRETVDLVPAMSVKARITAVNAVPVGEGVSYGLHYRSPGSVRICTVPLGYADGLARGLSGRCNFILDGQYVHQVGLICMDQCMFEIDLRSRRTLERIEAQEGDVVTVVGRDGDAEVTITDMARTLGTIEHEVAIGFAQRLPRLFV